MRTRRTNRGVIYYVTPNMTEEIVSDVRKWLTITNTKILHNYDYATPDHDVWQLFDRGFEILRDGKPDPKAYQELKRLIGIDGEDRISYNFFEELEEREQLVEKNILEEEESLY